MGLQAKEHQEVLTAMGSQETGLGQILSEPPEGTNPPDLLISDFWSLEF